MFFISGRAFPPEEVQACAKIPEEKTYPVFRGFLISGDTARATIPPVMKKVLIIASACLVLALVFMASRCGEEPPVQGPPGSGARTKAARPEKVVRELGAIGKSSASTREGSWKDPLSGELKVRKTLEMTSVPVIEEIGSRATARMGVQVTEGAEVWNAATGSWEAMPEEKFREWIKRDPADRHVVTATMVKELDETGGPPITRSQTATGDGAENPSADYNETESGINITLNWKGDTITIRWRSGELQETTEEIRLPFSERFRAPESEPETVPADPAGE